MSSSPDPQVTPIFQLIPPATLFAHPDVLALAAIEMSDAVRNNVRVFDGAPHGFYVVEDSAGQRYCFNFCKGNDINVALDESFTSLQASLESEKRRIESDSSWQNVDMLSALLVAGASSQSRVVHPSTTPMLPSMPVSSSQAHQDMHFDASPSGFVDSARMQLQATGGRSSQLPLWLGKDSNSLIPINSVDHSVQGIFYCAAITLDSEAYPANQGQRFFMPADTRACESWMFNSKYGYITKAGKAPTATKPACLKGRGEPTTVVLLDIRKTPEGVTLYRPVDFDTSIIPPTTTEENELGTIRYADGGEVYIRRFLERKITALFPCWNWQRNEAEHSFAVQLPCTLAYAANNTILSQKYDGNLGLGLPRVSTLTLAWGISDGYVEFCDASQDRRVYSAREFHLRLISPIVQGRGDAVILDSGSVFSSLPVDVVDEISTLWLDNQKTADGGQPDSRRPYYLPSAKGRYNLNMCDIEFTFCGADGGEEKFLCPAKPFLTSPWSYMDYYKPRGEVAHFSPIPAAAKVCPIRPARKWNMSNNGPTYVLGMNFHWAAIVHYVGPKLNTENLTIEPPYVRLAPQRVVQRPPGGNPRGPYKTYTEKDIVFPRGFPLPLRPL
ncbi:hypothetical protein C8Q77DRAFT_1157019 [Trametes polyzona]|nr:hypothetical protein C8Q77DRAFT_1157019 [Trametes polyzona]